MNFLLYLVILIGYSLPVYVSYTLLFGRGKILHFGTTGMSLVAAYAMYLPFIATGNYFISILIQITIVLLVSALFAWLSLRLEPDGLGIMTIAIHLVILSVVLNWTSLTRGALGIPGIQRVPGFTSLAMFALLSITLGALWCGVIWWVSRGKFGRQLQALSEHQWHAQALGISRAKAHFIAFFLSGMGACITNFISPQYVGILHTSDYAFSFFVFYLAIVIAGKPGSVVGAIISTILFMLLREGLRFLPLPISAIGPLRFILFGTILLIAVWVRRREMFPVQRTI